MTQQSLKKLFDSFNNLNILIVGDVMVDSYLWGKVSRISPEAPVPIIATTKKEDRLGGAANVGLNVKSLGAQPILCAVIGDDLKGNTFLNLLEKNHLSNEGIILNRDQITTTKTRIISGNQHMLRVDEEMDSNINAEIEEKLINRISVILKEKKINAIIFEDYDKGTITKKVIEKTVDLANKIDIPTLVDPKKRNFLDYQNVTLFKPNFKELVEGLKMDIPKGNFDKLHEAAQMLHRNFNIKYIFITLSESGVFINEDGFYHVLPAEVRDIADVSGAGDTVISVASVCLASGISPRELAAISNLAGGLVCEKTGVVPIDKKQLLEECIRYFLKDN